MEVPLNESVNSTEIRILFPEERILPFVKKFTPNSFDIWELSTSLPLKEKAVLRERISIELILDYSVIISSTIPCSTN